MALSGSLKDIGIIDLIQFPHQGRKTGLLSIRVDEMTTAFLYYHQGNFIHAENGSLEGVEALVPLVDLKEASFVFESEVPYPRKTIIQDLHHTLLQVLKLRDERKSAERAEEKAPESASQRLHPLLTTFFERNTWLHYAVIVGTDAQVLLERAAAPDHTIASYEPHRKALIQLLRAYPGGAISRVIIDHESGLTVATTLKNKQLLMVTCDSAAMMGAVVAAVSKLAQAINESCP